MVVLVVVIILAIVLFVYWLRRRGRFISLHSEHVHTNSQNATSFCEFAESLGARLKHGRVPNLTSNI